MSSLEPLVLVCCLAQWVLQRFAGMEVCYLVVPGIPHTSTRGWKKPRLVFHGGDRVYYEIDKLDPHFRDHMREIMLLLTVRGAPNFARPRGAMFPEVKFKYLSWKTTE